MNLDLTVSRDHCTKFRLHLNYKGKGAAEKGVAIVIGKLNQKKICIPLSLAHL